MAHILLPTLLPLLSAGLLALGLRWGRRGGALAVLGTYAWGALFGGVVSWLAGRLEGWLGLGAGEAADSLSSAVLAWGVFAPLRQGLQLLAVRPGLRGKLWKLPSDALLYPAAAALGFSAVRGAWLLGSAWGWEPLGRALLGLLVHPLLVGAWGVALARSRRRRMAGPRFNAAWLLAAVLTGAIDPWLYALPGSGQGVLWGRLGGAVLFAFAWTAWAFRDLLRRHAQQRDGNAAEARDEELQLPNFVPSLAAMREALRKAERPVLLGWVGFGALVTLGSLGLGLAVASWLGQRYGFDFASIEAERVGPRMLRPLLLLLGCALGSFLPAGWLIAKAAASRTVLEPALGMGLALGAVLLTFGGMNPVAIVVAGVLLPMAFLLGCLGAWLALPK